MIIRLKKITAVFVCMLLIHSGIITADAAEPKLSYGVEYSENQTIITLYLSIIDAFDIALIYDPAKVNVTSMGFTTEFKQLQAKGANQTISIYNDDAMDKAGNTYAVFTGAGVSSSGGGAIDFANKPLATITFEGNLAGAEIRLITNSAAEENVMNAEVKDTISLGESPGTVITPEPVNSSEETNKAENNGVQGNDAVQDTKAVDVGTADTVSTEDNIVSISDEPAEDAEAADSTERAEDETPDAGAVPEEENSSDEETVGEKTHKAGSLIAWIGAGLAAAPAVAAAVVVLIRKKTER